MDNEKSEPREEVLLLNAPYWVPSVLPPGDLELHVVLCAAVLSLPGTES